jgi:hypothetical protein
MSQTDMNLAQSMADLAGITVVHAKSVRNAQLTVLATQIVAGELPMDQIHTPGSILNERDDRSR